MDHYKSKCPKIKYKKATWKHLEKKVNNMLMMVEGDVKPHNDVWIANSAASTYITNNKVGLYDVKDIHKLVKIGNGKLVDATKVGWLNVFCSNKEAENKDFILENVQYIPSFWVNLVLQWLGPGAVQ